MFAIIKFQVHVQHSSYQTIEIRFPDLKFNFCTSSIHVDY
jgi:hypothetical protein